MLRLQWVQRLRQPVQRLCPIVAAAAAAPAANARVAAAAAAVPAPQSVQLPEPLLLACLPGSQALHDRCPLGDDFPAEQCEQSTFASPLLEDPELQGVQVVANVVEST